MLDLRISGSKLEGFESENVSLDDNWSKVNMRMMKVGKLLLLTMITLLLNLLMTIMDLVVRTDTATTLKMMARLPLGLPIPTVELVLQETTMTQEELLVRQLNLALTLEKSMTGQIILILRPIPSLIMKVRKLLRHRRRNIYMVGGASIRSTCDFLTTPTFPFEPRPFSHQRGCMKVRQEFSWL